MPRRREEAITNYLADYGYTIDARSLRYRNRETPLTLYNHRTARRERMTLRNFQNHVRTGRIVPVDPFINAFGDLNTELLYTGPHERPNARLQAFEQTTLPQFANEPLPVKTETIKTFQHMANRMRLHQDIAISFDENNQNANKINMFAFTTLLKNIILSPFHRTSLEITYDDNRVEHRLITPNTLRLLLSMLKHLFYGDEFEHDYSDSDKAILFALSTWQRLELIFTYHNPKVTNILEGRRKQTAGFFPFLNTSPLDLSRYGIYHDYKAENYKDNCLVHAIAQSGLLDAPSLQFLRTIINVRTFPLSSLTKLSKTIKINFHVTKHNGKGVHTKDYSASPTNPTLKLVIIHRHFMLDEIIPTTPFYIKHFAEIEADKRINQSRKQMIKKYSPTRWEYAKKGISISQVITLLENSLQQMTDEQYTQAIKQWSNKNNDFQPITSLNYRLAKYKKQPVKGEAKDFAKWSTVTDYESKTPEEIKQIENEFTTIMQTYNINNPTSYKSISDLGYAILHSQQCFANVYQLIGPSADFVRKCCSSPLNGCAYGKPVHVIGNIVQIDRNSSYPAVYYSMEGIPSGKPQIIHNFTPDIYVSYFILVNVLEFKCKHENDAFPLISSTGYHYYDKTYFEMILEHYDVKYVFVSGISFPSYNSKIADIACALYNKRIELKQKHSDTQMIIKRLLNCLWGKSIQKDTPTYTVFVASDKQVDFEHFNQDFIYAKSKSKRGDYQYRLIKPLLTHWTIPQFASCVLSYSRRFMQNIIYSANVDVYYSNTDSLTLRLEDLPKLKIVMGDGLGDFSVEVNSSEFFALGPCKNLHILHDGTERIRYPRKIYGDAKVFFNKMCNDITRA